MRWIARIGVCLLLLFLAGCRTEDVLFGLFGSHFTDGATPEDREANYDREVERWKGHQSESPSDDNRYMPLITTLPTAAEPGAAPARGRM
jgi:hypothetical protein